MKITKIGLTVVSATIFLSGCAGSPAWMSLKMSSTSSTAKANNAKIMGLQIGQLRDTVVALLGAPEKREAYRTKNGEVEFLFYRTEAWDGRGSVVSDKQFTPVAFSAGKLEGWGRNLYDQTIKLSLTTP
jgi:outer membrane murein-binding lipoprotein Lpp